MAFYERTARQLQVELNASESNVKPSLNGNGTKEYVAYRNLQLENVPVTASEVNVTPELVTVNDKMAHQLADRILELISLKADNAIRTLKASSEAFNVKPDVKNPISVKAEQITVKQEVADLFSKEIAVPMEILAPPTKSPAAPEELLPVPQEVNVKQEAVTVSDSKEILSALQATSEIFSSAPVQTIPLCEVEEKTYEDFDSDFLTQVKRNVIHDSSSIKFEQPENYWTKDTIPVIKWVTIRFRCLIESTIKLSNRRIIDYDTLAQVADAFYRLTESQVFKSLPQNYPYTVYIKLVKEKLDDYLSQHTEGQNLRFRLSPAAKAELIAKRFEMADFVPKMKFSELTF